MARAIWKGVVRFGGHAVAVKLYSAVEDRTVRFRLLDERTGRPVKQRMVNPSTGDEVPYDRIRRGYEVEEGIYVVLDEEELESIEPEKSREIEITRFLDPAIIDHRWYDRPYHLGPDESAAAYFSLTRALAAEGKEGLARWTMRNKEYVGALRAEDDHLALITLRHAGEVIPVSALEPPSGREPEPQELKMAEQLVEALAGDFVPTDYRDEYRDRVMELIEAKAEGKTIEFREPAKRRAAGDLAASLEASIRAAKERQSA
ncbi:MAG: Ku protein [Gemmatimonadota bacterium]